MKKTYLLCFVILFIYSNTICQNIGIGTSNPTKGRLEVFGAVGTTSAIFGGDGAGVSVQRNYPALGFNQYYNTQAWSMVPGNSLVQYLDLPSGSLVFDTYSSSTNILIPLGGQTRRLTFRQNGNVSIATYEANASLFVNGNFPGITTARFRGTQHNTVFADRLTGLPTQHTYINAGKTGSQVIINDQGLGNVYIGNGTSRVGINVADPTSVIDLKQVASKGLVLVAPAFSFNNWEFTVNHEINESHSDLWVYYNNQYRGNFFSGDGLYYQFSDQRLKKNVQKLENTLDKVLAMRPVQYEMKYQNDGHIQSIGFLAQEVKSLFPELVEVIEGTEHGYKGITDLHTMNYDGLGPVAIKAIQEQQEKIRSLKKKNEDLRKRIDEAEKAISIIQ